MIRRLIPLFLLILGASTLTIATTKFTHVQGGFGATSGAATSLTIAPLTNNPTPGNIVCLGIEFDQNVSSVTAKDANNNSYTFTPNSPAPLVGSRKVYLAYLLLAPANASKTLTFTWTTSADAQIWAEEFSVFGGTQYFDVDVVASGPSGGTINTPSITASSGELLFSVAIPATPNNITAPAAGATLGVWTGAAGGIQFGAQAEYLLNSSLGSTAVQYTLDGSNTWSAGAMAFGVTPQRQPVQFNRNWPGFIR